MKRSLLYTAITLCAIFAGAAFAQQNEATTTTTTLTNATGTISQLNYGTDGDVNGFLIGTNILLTFSKEVCGGLGTLGAVGNAVTYSGTALTATSGFQTVMVASFTNTTTKATYTPTTSDASTTYGPTSGTVKQLNYGAGGSIDGFLFTASGSTPAIFVGIGQAGTALTTALTVGATVSVTGTTSPARSACSTTATIETVNASSLTIGSQTFVFNSGGGFGHGGGGFGGHH